MPVAQLKTQKLIVLNSLSSIATSGIRDKELIKRLTDQIETLEQSFTEKENRSIAADLEKIAVN